MPRSPGRQWVIETTCDERPKKCFACFNCQQLDKLNGDVYRPKSYANLAATWRIRDYIYNRTYNFIVYKMLWIHFAFPNFKIIFDIAVFSEFLLLLAPKVSLADRTIGHAFGTACRLYVVCLSSVCLSSATFCIVAKRYVLAKNCLKKWIGYQGQKVDFGGRRHVSASGNASTVSETAILPFFVRTARRSILVGTNGLSSSKPCAYCRIVRSELKPEVVLPRILLWI